LSLICTVSSIFIPLSCASCRGKVITSHGRLLHRYRTVFESRLKRLDSSRAAILSMTMFCIDHAEAAEEVRSGWIVCP
jgi:hypothetical protein